MIAGLCLLTETRSLHSLTFRWTIQNQDTPEAKGHIIVASGW